ncbi:MAG: hypothetical protein JWQ48_460 [Conexibacter sp.]|nr:hypothetical protein [Conexibacter sp.]
MTEGLPEVIVARQEWSATELGLLDCALEFYGAADAVIDYGGPDRPRLRYDALGLQAVREAMGLLERRIRAAGAEGLAPERIARITRLERDVVERILRPRRGDR